MIERLILLTSDRITKVYNDVENAGISLPFAKPKGLKKRQKTLSLLSNFSAILLGYSLKRLFHL